MGRNDSNSRRVASASPAGGEPSAGGVGQFGPARGPLPIADASAGMLVQRVLVHPEDVVFVKGIVEASEGIALLFADRGGELTLAAPLGRGDEFAELLLDLERDVGARRRDVMLQFLIEAITLSGLGGGIGIAGGYVGASLVRLGLKRWVELPPVHTPLWAIVVAFTFCAFLGIIFGIYPAAKASKLDPIEALRYE